MCVVMSEEGGVRCEGADVGGESVRRSGRLGGR